ncbi:hypothetical protein [Levilactobacillus spicheri]|uniref:Uncharacterized protein n=1 Tax=Levilactobacillus spicheri TaxID=216463 RepID=A0ABQ0WNF0_9LACO|nr:hypothetical protein [Levilactobacillus spicheri]GEO66571.1 hypothetical protein LSP04_09900 [Levilactobacillus spicheri]
MTALVAIILIIVIAAAGQFYLNNLADFRKKSKHLATHNRFTKDSNQRFI